MPARTHAHRACVRRAEWRLSAACVCPLSACQIVSRSLARSVGQSTWRARTTPERRSAFETCSVAAWCMWAARVRHCAASPAAHVEIAPRHSARMEIAPRKPARRVDRRNAGGHRSLALNSQVCAPRLSNTVPLLRLPFTHCGPIFKMLFYASRQGRHAKAAIN